MNKNITKSILCALALILFSLQPCDAAGAKCYVKQDSYVYRYDKSRKMSPIKQGVEVLVVKPAQNGWCLIQDASGNKWTIKASDLQTPRDFRIADNRRKEIEHKKEVARQEKEERIALEKKKKEEAAAKEAERLASIKKKMEKDVATISDSPCYFESGAGALRILFNPSGDTFTVFYKDGNIKTYSVESKKLVREFKLKGEGTLSDAHTISFSDDGERMAMLSNDEKGSVAYVLDAYSGNVLYEERPRIDNPVDRMLGIQFARSASKQGKSVFTLQPNPLTNKSGAITMRLMSVADGELLAESKDVSYSFGLFVDKSINPHYIFLLMSDNTITYRRLGSSGKSQELKLPKNMGVRSVGYGPNGELYLGVDQRISSDLFSHSVIDLITRKTLYETYSSTSDIFSQFSPDLRYYITGGADDGKKMIDLHTKREVFRFEDMDFIDFTRDGKYMIVKGDSEIYGSRVLLIHIETMQICKSLASQKFHTLSEGTVSSSLDGKFFSYSVMDLEEGKSKAYIYKTP